MGTPKSGSPATGRRGCIVDGNDLEGEGGAHGARIERVTGQICDGDEEAPFEEVGGDRDQDEGRLAEDPEIWKHPPCRQWSKPDPDEQIRQDEEDKEDKEDETLDPRGPRPANFREEGFQHQWEDDPADGTSYGSDTGGVGALGEEEVTDGCDGRGEDQGRAGSGRGRRRQRGNCQYPSATICQEKRGFQKISDDNRGKSKTNTREQIPMSMMLAIIRMLPARTRSLGPRASKTGPIWMPQKKVRKM
ncbi:MAG: hypothetical protein L6R42_000058 [Xanthoria sp. 1 TBL-2021]|nr:MAG: hypothetical protein L6R42_000058 [Xanthoria sp. 1 TBL-2021]